jgi:two-component system, OmpR family, sensor kinase
VSRFVVTRNLRPLHEVAQVAAEVSRRELDRGEVDLSLRVPESNSDPSNEVGRVGLALNTMLSNVERALAARQASETKVRQFVADASHELRNPLAAIRGYAELTRRGREDLPEDTQFAMGRIESESERMSRLVEDLLLLARLDKGPALQLSDVELTDLLANATADAQVAGPDHEWDVEVPEEPVIVQADRFRIHQVIANLLANARTHTPAGTHVTASVAIDGMYAVVAVADDGPGISPELLPKVFERFVRADVSRVRKAGQSTGLGLAIVAAVVQAHGGTVSVQSRPGRTRFEIRLRLA